MPDIAFFVQVPQEGLTIGEPHACPCGILIFTRFNSYCGFIDLLHILIIYWDPWIVSAILVAVLGKCFPNI